MGPHDKNAPAASPGYITPPLPSDLQIFGPESQGGANCEVVMATVEGGGEETGGITVAFVELPSAKVQARISIFAVPTTGSDNPMVDDSDGVIVGTWGLWAPLLTRAKFGGRAGNFFPTRNVIGTKAAPLQIPADPGLWGHEFEIVTAQAGRLMLRLNEIATGGTADYQIRAQVTYQAIVPMSPQEWTRFCDRAGISASANHVG